MSRWISGSMRRVGSLTVAATLVLASLPTLVQAAPMAADCTAIQFEVSNPSPGTRLDPGTYVVQGFAQDTRAEDGPGIDRVDFFLGDRDQGGLLLGHAVPTEAGPFGPNSFATSISVPNLPGGRDIFGYAHSTVTGQENVITVPIAVGIDSNKVPGLMTAPMEVTCTGTDLVEAVPSPAVDVAGAQAAQEAPVEMGEPVNLAEKMYLEIGNPSSGDTIHIGTFTMVGLAFDRAAEQGAGIESIDIFLDDRNAGGTLIGTGVMGAASPAPDDPQIGDAGWIAQVTIPRKLTGQHTLFVHALSSATGGELVVGVPVVVQP